MSGELEILRAREAQIKRRIAAIQAKQKSDERKRRTARLIRWGIVAEAMIKEGKIGVARWIDACRKVLSDRDFEIAAAEICPSSLDEAHFCVSPAEKHRAPAVGKGQAEEQ